MPIACGGQVVFPGDILVGDKDGIVVIHRQDAEEIAEIAQEKKRKEEKTFESIESDWTVYADKHEKSTQKRMEGKKIEILDEDCMKRYTS